MRFSQWVTALFGERRSTLVVVAGGAAVTLAGLGASDRGLISADAFNILWIAVGAITSVLIVLVEIATPSADQLVARLAGDVRRHESLERGFLLGDSAHPIALALSVDAGDAGSAAARTVSWSDVLGFYLSLRPARLLVIGAPGAGKTALTAELALEWLVSREEADVERLPARWARRVPVRLSLANWRAGVSLEAWLAEQVADGYGLPRASAAALIADRRIVPVLDGLDEMDPDGGEPVRAIRALTELNGYRADHEDAPVVVTCREARYEQLLAGGHRLGHATRLRVAPVTAAQAVDFLRRRDVDRDRWAPVVRELDGCPDGDLAQALSTPWRLTLAVTVYEADRARDPADLLRLRRDQLEEHVLSLYVESATRVKNALSRQRYRPTPARVVGWLARLADHLERQEEAGAAGGSDLLLHDLWPIAGPRAPRLTHAGLLGLAVGVSLFCLAGLRFDPGQLILAVVVALTGLGRRPSATLLAGPLLRRRRGIAGFAPVRVLLAVLGVLAYGLECVVLAAFAYLLFVAAVAVGMGLPVILPLLVAAAVADLVAPGFSDSSAFGFVGFPCVLLGFWLFAALAQSRIAWRIAGPAARLGAAPWARCVSLWHGEAGVLGLSFSQPDGESGPRSVVVSDFVTSTACLLGGTLALVVGNRLGSGSGSTALPIVLLDFAGVLLIGLGLLRFGGASRRYLAMLICTRRKLPWRLGRFMDWACEAGLLRKSGIAYQFRHAELQAWLAGRGATAGAATGAPAEAAPIG